MQVMVAVGAPHVERIGRALGADQAEMGEEFLHFVEIRRFHARKGEIGDLDRCHAFLRNFGRNANAPEGRETMSKPPVASSAARDALRAFAPKFIELTDDVVYSATSGSGPGLSKRDRSLITCAALIALNRTEQQRGHFARALDNGVTKDEIIEMITHLAFYAGWPVVDVGGQRRQESVRRGDKK